MKLERDTLFRMNNYIPFVIQHLDEAYKKSNDIDWVEALRTYRDFMRGEVSKEKLEEYTDRKKIAFEIIKGEDLIGGAFDLNTQKIVMIFTQDVGEDIFYADEADLQNLAANFWVNFVHEDTYRQRFNAAGSYNIYKKYRTPATLDWVADIEANLDYYDQSMEADAYGRDVAARLQAKFGERSSLHMLNLISSGRPVNDAYCQKLISIYKDPRISKKSHKAFFRAIYDFLSGNEL